MPKQTVTYTGPFKADALINQFGDFDTLVVEYTREKPTEENPTPEADVEVLLKSTSDEMRVAILDAEDAGQALLSFFQQQAKKEWKAEG